MGNAQTFVILTIALVIATRYMAVHFGFARRVEVVYSRQDRISWALACGLIPVATGLTEANVGLVVLGVVTVWAIYSRPKYYRLTWRAR